MTSERPTYAISFMYTHIVILIVFFCVLGIKAPKLRTNYINFLSAIANRIFQRLCNDKSNISPWSLNKMVTTKIGNMCVKLNL